MEQDKGRRSELKKILLVAVLCALIGALSATAVTTSILYGQRTGAPERLPRQAQRVEEESRSPIPDIAREVAPAVVGIVTVRIDRDFFFRPIRSEAVGSGVIVDPKGYILTNDHVVGGVDRIKVYLGDGRSFPAERLYSDPGLDLAVIKINAENLTTARLGDSDRVVVGDLAVAIGNPLGLTLQRTVTAGIISALKRTVVLKGEQGNVLMQDLIQTDASINPGNSGGPLVNGRGEVIGINTVKASQAEAIGFAIPINIAKPILKSIAEKGRFEKPYIGVKGIDREIARLMDVDVPVDGGVYVLEVTEKSPAALAGLKEGDVITRIADRPVDSVAKMRQVLYSLGPGRKIEVELIRGGRKMIKTLVVEEERG
ncbi:S1C family serine protease [Thermosediminibacter litoriperuensis]|uniref:S1-C subfamily serine protease n=1 Tax=Thermosediminibacter litoriperuensis TaxID=291989 RepID=A0A5S5AXH6_9FIRM|nr:trypsin-like peptidase domain-containing protein [Thermosediminibacter litoriperuensis]TYP57456.1 S1-C subfamily serine protease [Thermosediminibacter litoriperuensis]